MTLRGIEAGYGGRPVLHGLSLSIEAGELVALIGPNGSGKSTLLKVMAGQMAPAGGAVQLDGKPLGTYSPKARGVRLAYFPQSRLVPPMDVQTLVAHGRFPRLGLGHAMGEADRAAVRRALEQTGLNELAGRPLSALSGGERQRAYLAMLIAQQADVLLLDEPGSFLDIGHQLEIMDILLALHRQGCTIVLAVHDLPLAFTYARRIVLLQEGGLADDGLPEAVAGRPPVERAFGVRLVSQADSALFRYRLERPMKEDLPR